MNQDCSSILGAEEIPLQNVREEILLILFPSRCPDPMAGSLSLRCRNYFYTVTGHLTVDCAPRGSSCDTMGGPCSRAEKESHCLAS